VAFTAPITLNLVTPRGVIAGLEVLGVFWKPVPFDLSPLQFEAGLYAWVDGIGARSQSGALALADDLLDRPILYKGIGDGELGVRGRLGQETGLIGPDAAHGHGIAMHARRASVVVGPLEAVEIDLTWLPEVVSAKGAAIISRWLEESWQTPAQLVRAAEKIAIRLGIHLGETAAPVQSQYAGAWDSDHRRTGPHSPLPGTSSGKQPPEA
jgi:hypothetical protein